MRSRSAWASGSPARDSRHRVCGRLRAWRLVSGALYFEHDLTDADEVQILAGDAGDVGGIGLERADLGRQRADLVLKPTVRGPQLVALVLDAGELLAAGRELELLRPPGDQGGHEAGEQDAVEPVHSHRCLARTLFPGKKAAARRVRAGATSAVENAELLEAAGAGGVEDLDHVLMRGGSSALMLTPVASSFCFAAHRRSSSSRRSTTLPSTCTSPPAPIDTTTAFGSCVLSRFFALGSLTLKAG